MATLFKNWTVTVQDSQSPYSPVSTLELHLFEGKVEIKTDPATGLQKVFTYGTTTLAAYAKDRNGLDAIALAADAVHRPGEYDFIELDLSGTLSSAAGETLYSVVGKPANAADFSSGRVIIDSTSLDDPMTKQTLANLGGGLDSVTDNIFFAGGTVKYSLYSVADYIANAADVIHLKLDDLPANIYDLYENILLAPPYYDTTLPAEHYALIPRFNVYYTDKNLIVARWKGVRAYKMSDGSVVIRLRSDQYCISHSYEFGSGVGELDLQGIISNPDSFIISVDVEDDNTHYRSFSKFPQYGVNISGPEGVMFTAYQSNGVENVGIGQWGFTNQDTDAPNVGIDMKHARGFRSGTPTYPNQLVGLPNGRVGFNVAEPLAAFHMVPSSNSDPLLAIGQGAISTGIRSVAMGRNSTASNTDSFSVGANSVASALSAMAFGDTAVASNLYSLALGRQATASGLFSMAMGFGAVASGQGSTAIGQSMTVSGTNSCGISLSSVAQVVTGNNTLSVVGGRVAIGTVSALSGGILTISDDSSLDFPRIRIRNSISSYTTADMYLGGIDFSSMYGVPTNGGASIDARAGADWNTVGTVYPAYLVFNTRAIGASSSVERVRIDANGIVQIGYGAALTGALLHIQSTGTAGSLDTKYTSGVGSSYCGHYFSSGLYGAYLGNTQGLSVNNLIVFSTGQVGIGTAVVPTGVVANSRLYVRNTEASGPVAVFRHENALQPVAYIGVNSRYLSTDRYGHISVTNIAGGEVVSLGNTVGNSVNNINLYNNGGGLKVGVLTTTPLNALDVGGSVAIGSYAGAYSAPIGGSLIMSGRLGIGISSPSVPLHIYTTLLEPIRINVNSASTAVITFANTTSYSTFIGISSTGKPFFGSQFDPTVSEIVVDPINARVGILTPTPWTTLHVNGNILVDTLAYIKANASDDAWVVYRDYTLATNLAAVGYIGSISSLVFQVASGNRAAISNVGAVSFGSVSPDGAWLHQYTSAQAGIRGGIYSNGDLAGGAVLEHWNMFLGSNLANTISYTYYGLSIRQSIGSGFTAPDYIALHVSDLSGLGSVINCYGLYIPAMTKGTALNYSAYFGGVVKFAGGFHGDYQVVTHASTMGVGNTISSSAMFVKADLTTSVSWKIFLPANPTTGRVVFIFTSETPSSSTDLLRVYGNTGDYLIDVGTPVTNIVFPNGAGGGASNEIYVGLVFDGTYWRTFNKSTY